jgi:hypothetical protein
MDHGGQEWLVTALKEAGRQMGTTGRGKDNYLCTVG